MNRVTVICPHIVFNVAQLPVEVCLESCAEVKQLSKNTSCFQMLGNYCPICLVNVSQEGVLLSYLLMIMCVPMMSDLYFSV